MLRPSLVKIGFEEGENVKSKRERRQQRCQQQTNFDKRSKAYLGLISYGQNSVNYALLRFRNSVFVSPKKIDAKKNPDSLFAVKFLRLVNTKL